MDNNQNKQDNPKVETYNTIQPTSSTKELEKYIPIRQPEPTRDINYSPFFDAAMCAVADRLTEFTDRETFNNVWTSSLFPERISKQFLRLTEQYAAPLHQRIAELEALNDKYREALENIAISTDGNNPGHAVFYFEARKALNHKDKENG